MENSLNWYKENYQKTAVSGDPSNLSSRLMHRMLEHGITRNLFPSVLEVGGNIGEHVRFVQHEYDVYRLTDIKEPGFNLDLPKKVEFQKADVEDLSFADSEFDRTISTCLLHHLNDPVQALRELRRVTKDGGVISILLPCDPGIMYRAFRMFTSVKKAIFAGIYEEQKLNHALEHRNHVGSLLVLLKNEFRLDKVKLVRFPFIVGSWNMNLVYYYQIQIFKEEE
jgi:ubiquinone/menaquinone biosynthesis C-methylase UbiE